MIDSTRGELGDVETMSDRGVNWVDVDVLSDAGVNWEDLNVVE